MPENSEVGFPALQVPAHATEEHSVGDIDAALGVAHEIVPTCHQSKGALDDPAAKQGLNAWHFLAAVNDFEHKDAAIDVASTAALQKRLVSIRKANSWSLP
jgi:hypothetical protein